MTDGVSFRGIVAPPGAATRRVLRLAVAAAAVVASRTAPAAEAAWRRLPSGLEVRRLTVRPSAELPVDAWLVRLDPALHELRVLRATSADEARTTSASAARVAPAIAAAEGALAVVNASYFDETGRALGLLVSRGAVITPVNGRGWGWAALSHGRLVVGDARSALPPDVSEGVQAGPVLVSAGAARPLTSERLARRAFVGSDGAGRLVLGATTGPVTLGELAARLALGQEAGGAGLVQALNLDGGSSAQLFVAGEEPPLKVAGVPVPVFLGAVARPGHVVRRPSAAPPSPSGP